MVKVELVSSDPHYPEGGIVKVASEHADRLIRTGMYRRVGESVAEQGFPDESWKEKDILKWITDKAIPVRYSVSSDTKKEVLERLRSGGFLGNS